VQDARLSRSCQADGPLPIAAEEAQAISCYDNSSVFIDPDTLDSYDAGSLGIVGQLASAGKSDGVDGSGTARLLEDRVESYGHPAMMARRRSPHWGR